MGEQDPLIELRGVGHCYSGKSPTRVLTDINISIDRGEFISIVGPSGSGKSTLLHMIGALDSPTEGELRIGGTLVSSLNSEERASLRRTTVGFVFQFHYLLPDFTVLENVLMPANIAHRQATKEDRQEAVDLLQRVGLTDRMNYRATDISGGQQQRAAVARALAGRKPLVLADEPTGNLDTRTGDEIFALMREFHRTLGVTFVVITHNPALAERSDRVLSIMDGKLEYDRRIGGNSPGS